MNTTLAQNPETLPANTHAFLDALRPHAARPLVFDLAGRRIQPGYHVTEVKAANVQALDCGGGLESWQETVVQLWDVPGKPDETHMKAGKFLSILDKVAARLPLDGAAQLVFEAGDGSGPAVRYTAEGVEVEDVVVVVRLSPVYATCKPRDRWLASLGVTAATLVEDTAAPRDDVRDADSDGQLAGCYVGNPTRGGTGLEANRGCCG